jgi:hypothetical protein
MKLKDVQQNLEKKEVMLTVRVTVKQKTWMDKYNVSATKVMRNAIDELMKVVK